MIELIHCHQDISRYRNALLSAQRDLNASHLENEQLRSDLAAARSALRWYMNRLSLHGYVTVPAEHQHACHKAIGEKVT